MWRWKLWIQTHFFHDYVSWLDNDKYFKTGLLIDADDFVFSPSPQTEHTSCGWQQLHWTGEEQPHVLL